MNWIYVACFEPEVVWGFLDVKLTAKRYFVAHILSFVLSPFVPGFIIYQKENKSEEIQKYKDQIVEIMGEDDENVTVKVLDLGRKITELDKAHNTLPPWLTVRPRSAEKVPS